MKFINFSFFIASISISFAQSGIVIIDDSKQRLENSFKTLNLWMNDSLSSADLRNEIQEIINQADRVMTLNNKCSRFSINSTPDIECKKLEYLIPDYLSKYATISETYISFQNNQISNARDRVWKFKQCGNQLARILENQEFASDYIDNIGVFKTEDVAIGDSIDISLGYQNKISSRQKLSSIIGDWVSTCGGTIIHSNGKNINAEFLRLINISLEKSPFVLLEDNNKNLSVFQSKIYSKSILINNNIKTKTVDILKPYSWTCLENQRKNIENSHETKDSIKQEQYKESIRNCVDPLLKIPLDGEDRIYINPDHYTTKDKQIVYRIAPNLIQIKYQHRSDSLELSKSLLFQVFNKNKDFSQYLQSRKKSIEDSLRNDGITFLGADPAYLSKEDKDMIQKSKNQRFMSKFSMSNFAISASPSDSMSKDYLDPSINIANYNYTLRKLRLFGNFGLGIGSGLINEELEFTTRDTLSNKNNPKSKITRPEIIIELFHNRELLSSSFPSISYTRGLRLFQSFGKSPHTSLTGFIEWGIFSLDVGIIKTNDNRLKNDIKPIVGIGLIIPTFILLP